MIFYLTSILKKPNTIAGFVFIQTGLPMFCQFIKLSKKKLLENMLLS